MQMNRANFILIFVFSQLIGLFVINGFVLKCIYEKNRRFY